MTRRPLSAILIIIALSSCERFLDLKADKTKFIVSKVSELQGMFDHEDTYIQSPAKSLLSSDDGYFSAENYNTILSQEIKNTYVWDPNADLTKEWSWCYQKIFRMNLILEEIDKLPTTGNDQEIAQLKGAALFVRAFAHYQIARLFAPPPFLTDPDNEFGIPLKLSADIEDGTKRATVKGSYNAIINDLNQSLTMLPDTGIVKTRPGKCAALALLAKIYLDQTDYKNAEKFADSSLSIYRSLIDYNDDKQVNINAIAPFMIFNTEVIYHASSTYDYDMRNFYADTSLLSSYDSADLRKIAYFQKLSTGAQTFKGSYGGSDNSVSFSGIATDEVLLIRAESRARNGNISGSIEDLNLLLGKRIKINSFVPITARSQEETVRMIISERRKELCFRSGVRWTDLRRLNADPQYALTLIRHVNGTRYELLPGDKRYLFQIPASVVKLNNLTQNPK
jgi:starch-binding outer membrane protein, SusD/RagB family